MNRRFARMMEFDRNGFPASGTAGDQWHVRDAISKHLEWDNSFDRTLWALDKKVNKAGRSFLWFSFWYADNERGLRGEAWKTTIQLFLDPEGSWSATTWEYVVIHEIGHWTGMWLLQPSDRTENWATDFQQWVFAGGEQKGHVYEALKAVGAQDSVVE